MGKATTLYDESVETVAAAEENDELDFGGGPSRYLDKSAFGLGVLSDRPGARRGLIHAPCLDPGDAELRFFLPEDAADLQRCLTVEGILRQPDRNTHEAMISANVFAFDADDSDLDAARGYLDSNAELLEKFLTPIVAQGRGIVSVTS